MEKTLVSIIIPVYNSENHIKKCLDSIKKQTYKNIEVICVNDGSTDSSLDVLEFYKKNNDINIQIISVKNGGQANARNIGIKMSNGKFIMFVDSDDYIEADMIETMIKKYTKYDVDLVACNINRINEDNSQGIFKMFKFDNILYFEEPTDIYHNPEIICFITGGPYAKLIKKDFLEKNNILFKKGFIYEDTLFTQTILSCNPKMFFCKEKFYNYIVHSNTTMTSKNSNVKDMFDIYDDIYDEYKKQNRDVFFKNELDFLCYYHVLIGTSYRMWKTKKYGLFKSINFCRKYVKRYNTQKNNKYISEKGFLAVLFVKIFG